ncbi:MAG: HAMP domain-containing histidine kinase [Defluviitaleaceae bacterium]|nr:HAMP domain-containing histidine kinase [Defluviitaleaceae bacterium]
MRLFAKFFLCATAVISVALLLSGYLLIAFSHESAVNREVDRALSQFQHDRFTVQANIIANAESMQEGLGISIFSSLSSELSGLTAFFDLQKQLIYSQLPAQADFALLGYISENTHIVEFQEIAGVTYILVGGMVTQSDITLYIIAATDISAVVAQRQYMAQSFVRIYFITLLLSMVMILILSTFITRPIKKMNKAAAAIAQGRYNQRLRILRGDEIGELSGSFNLMAEAIEEKIYELLENARQKEDFVANFAHELKTPLTSVIGYADMIYQKNLPASQVKDAAWYILNEGLRLESLSLKLMDLIVLNRQDFVLEEMDVNELMQDISGTLKPMLTDKEVTLILKIQPAYIKVEYDLFKTLMFNLIDNAVKAGCKGIHIGGKKNKNYYSVSVSDDGSGMPESELARITEAFYTVDKSRSRRQHGAGIGLALVAKIAEVHGSTLTFYSSENVGTAVTVDLQCGGDGSNG